MRTKKFLLLLPLLFNYFISTSQEGELQDYQNGFYIKQFSEVGGLAYNSCTAMYEDSRGFLWIGTFNGLSRFDGKKFINYSVNEGLPGSNITQITEDAAGLIYVATKTGIARYTGYNKSSSSYFYTYPQTKGLTGYLAGMQAMDSSTLIFQRANGAVYLLKKNKLSQLSKETGSPGYLIHRDGNRYFYALTSDTIRVFNARFENIKNIYWNRSAHATAAYTDKNGGLHLYGNGKKQKIKDGQMVLESQVPDSIVRFADTDTRNAMFYDRNGIIYSYDGRLSTPVLDMKKLSVETNILLQAKDGSIWAGSSGKGLFRITTLPYNTVELPEGEQIICYYKNGRKVLYNRDSFNKNPVFTRARDSLKQIHLATIVDSKGTAWFCTAKGLYKQPSAGQGHFYVFPGNELDLYQGARSVIHGVERPNGDMWFYGRNGVIRHSNNEFTHYSTRNGLPGHGGVMRIYVDKNETPLVLDGDQKLYYISGDTVLPALNAAGRIHFTANMVTIDNKGYSWVAYNKKLYRLEKQANGTFATTDSFAPAETDLTEVKNFEFDLQDNCWVGYTGGNLQVFFINKDGRYNPTNSITFTKDDGLAPFGSYFYSFYADDNGNMHVVPVIRNRPRILMSFSIQNAVKRKQLEVPAAGIAGVAINHQKADWLFPQDLRFSSDVTASIRLSHAENNIIFNYNSSSLRHPSNILYKTTLKGFDKDWHVTSASSTSYTNLPAGTYTFLLQAANVNGTWGPVAQYSFSIRPPWYKTWWAVLLWIATAAGIILFFFFLRVKSLRMNMQMSNLKENNTFKSSLIGLIGHDMMTPLRYIAKVSLQLKTHNNKLSQKTTLETLGDINVTASRLQFFGESILHWINLQNSEFSPAIEQFRINETIHELVELHELLAVEKDNMISHEIPDDLFCYQDAMLVKIILHNLLLNANKFTANGTIRMTAGIEEDWLVLKVIDTGKGMDQQKVDSLNQFQPIYSSPGTLKEKGWGMGYKMIIDLLKFSEGTLNVKSKLNEGTEVTIKLFSGRKEYFLRQKLVNTAI